MIDRTKLESGITPTVMDGGSIDNVANADRVIGSMIPQAILDLGFSATRQLDASGAQADCYLMTGPDGATVFAKVYRRGLRPKAAILERLGKADIKHVIQLLHFDAGDEGRQAWELLEYARFGTLGTFIREQKGAGVDPNVAHAILRELATALAHIHTLDIEHRDIKPDNILIRDEASLDLVLTDFGIASDNTQAGRFTAHAHHSLLYAPPEAQYGRIEREKWDYWSLGMILVELLTGVHPLLAAGGSAEDQAVERSIRMRFLHMTSGDELVSAVQQDDWRLLCRGLLRKDPTQRWAGAEVSKWLDNPADPGLKVAEERAPPSVDAFAYNGQSYEAPGQFAAAMRISLDELRHLWRTDSEFKKLADWLSRNDYTETLKLLRSLRESGSGSIDVTLMLVLNILDDSQSLIFQGVELTEASICSLVDDAVIGNPAANKILEKLFEEKVISIAAGKPDFPPEVAAIGRKWDDAAKEYASEALRVASASSGEWTAEPLGKVGIASFLASMVSGCRSEQVLRSKAWNAATSAANRVTWYRSIGDPATATPPGLLLLVRTAHVAEAVVKREQARISADARRLWQFMGRGALIAIPFVLFGVWVSANFDNDTFKLNGRDLDLLDWIFIGSLLVAWGASNAWAYRQATGDKSDG